MSLSLHAQLSVDICIDISIARSRFRAPLARARGPARSERKISISVPAIMRMLVDRSRGRYTYREID